MLVIGAWTYSPAPAIVGDRAEFQHTLTHRETGEERHIKWDAQEAMDAVEVRLWLALGCPDPRPTFRLTARELMRLATNQIIEHRRLPPPTLAGGQPASLSPTPSGAGTPFTTEQTQ